MSAYWFAALPSAQELSRVSLDFGLRRADRLLRELVVPEMGRVWFVRQLSWPVAALALRDELRGVANVKASSIAHGLESIGCKLAWTHDAEAERILGKRAFGRDRDAVWGFKELRDPKHYVRNTHRQAASRALQTDGGIERLALTPELEAKTLFEALQVEHPERFEDGQLRTLQRRIRWWRAAHGPDQEVSLAQLHRPGEAAQTDFTHTGELAVTIAG